MRRRTIALLTAPLVLLAAALLFFVSTFGTCAAPRMEGLHPDLIRLPDGFRFEVWVPDVPGARSMALGAQGTLFVGTRDAGRVYAIPAGARRAMVLLEGLDTPNGVAFRDGALYVAEITRVLRYDGIEDRLDDPPAPVVVRDDFPGERHHGWKFIAFGPDGKLYVPVGAPGNNVLRADDPRYSSITRMAPDGTDFEVFAEGVRNTVGFDWHPESGVLWFTDNGRDWLGDDGPPDELNRAPEPGLHFGYPFRHGASTVDPEYGDAAPDRALTPPVLALGPHVAALGMRFYRGAAFPDAYRHAVFIAEHGSWNRTDPIGYRVTVARPDADGAWRWAPFAEGFLQDGKAWGRPVDVQELPDGSLLVSDDRAGAIYRITFEG